MRHTLENFFKTGQYNSLTNRKFTTIDGRLYEQTATDWSMVSSPTFHDLVSGNVKRIPFNLPDHSKVGIMGGIYRGPDALNMSFSGNKITVEQYTPEGFLKLLANPPAAWSKSGFWMEAYRAFAKDPEWKAKAEAIIQRNSESIGMDAEYQERVLKRVLESLDMPEAPSGEELAQRFMDLQKNGKGIVYTVDSFSTANEASMSERRLAKRFVEGRAQLSIADIVRAKHKFRSGNLELEAGVVLDWITRKHPSPEVDIARAQEITRIIKGDFQAGSFVCKILRELASPYLQKSASDFDFAPGVLRQMNHMQLVDMFNSARPVALAVTDINRAFKAIKDHHPEAAYLYFNDQLAWMIVNHNFESIVVGSAALDDLLETAALAAVDRDLLNKWLNPAT